MIKILKYAILAMMLLMWMPPSALAKKITANLQVSVPTGYSVNINKDKKILRLHCSASYGKNKIYTGSQIASECSRSWASFLKFKPYWTTEVLIAKGSIQMCTLTATVVCAGDMTGCKMQSSPTLVPYPPALNCPLIVKNISQGGEQTGWVKIELDVRSN